MTHVEWAKGDAYEAYVGRWSTQVAEAFVPWLEVPERKRWLDLGCGTGALTAQVLAIADPARVIGVDRSLGFLTTAHRRIADDRVAFCVADAQWLPFAEHAFDIAVSALTLNFVPDPRSALAELARVAAPEGVVAAYVWDYAEGMEMMRHFWDAATAFDPSSASLAEGLRFPLCRPEPLTRLWTDAGLEQVTVRAIEVPTVFADFDDFWVPFLGGQGPAPSFAMSLTEERRDALRDLVRSRLPVDGQGRIPLIARAWAVRGAKGNWHAADASRR
jgi:SAM-dependent methyltransferase